MLILGLSSKCCSILYTVQFNSNKVFQETGYGLGSPPPNPSLPSSLYIMSSARGREREGERSLEVGSLSHSLFPEKLSFRQVFFFHSLSSIQLFVLSPWCSSLQGHLGSLLESVIAYTQRESEDEMAQLLSGLAQHCLQDHRLKEEVEQAVYVFPSVVSHALVQYSAVTDLITYMYMSIVCTCVCFTVCTHYTCTVYVCAYMCTVYIH